MTFNFCSKGNQLIVFFYIQFLVQKSRPIYLHNDKTVVSPFLPGFALRNLNRATRYTQKSRLTELMGKRISSLLLSIVGLIIRWSFSKERIELLINKMGSPSSFGREYGLNFTQNTKTNSSLLTFAHKNTN